MVVARQRLTTSDGSKPPRSRSGVAQHGGYLVVKSSEDSFRRAVEVSRIQSITRIHSKYSDIHLFTSNEEQVRHNTYCLAVLLTHWMVLPPPQPQH